MPSLRVGLTGGIASGKSTVAALLVERGAVLIDADVLAREVVAAGTPGLARVVEAFGPQVLTAKGDLDRPAVGALVFADEAARRRLEGIVHPLVYERIAQLESQAPTDAIVVHDIPLLVENDRAGDFDAVVVVDVAPELQLQRMVVRRGWSESDARSRMAAQVDRDVRRRAATYVIDNGGSLDELRERVAEVVNELEQLVSRGPGPVG